MHYNLTMQTDWYQLTMMYGYFRTGKHQRQCVFDLYFRRTPWGNGYALAAGLDEAIDYILNLRFTEDDVDFVRAQGLDDPAFLDYLRQLRFTGDLWAVPEGTVVFPNEPLVRVLAPLAEAQLIETMLLNIINHQPLIATKASRIVEAASGDTVLEFGLRRAQGPDAGLYGSRASIIGGCQATSNVLAGKLFDVAVRGTHGHSWVMSFPSELEAFRAYAAAFPDSCLLLVDTYHTLRSGVPNAIQVARELREQGHRFVGIRLDSGDIAYLSKEARRMLDEAGFPDAVIVASGDLDEDVIRELKMQGARVDIWGVGTHLITAHGWPALGGVYKLAALEENGQLRPKIKVSESADKTTNPGYKKVTRLYDVHSGKAVADLISLEHEVLPKPLTIFDPIETWKQKTLRDYTARPLLEPIFVRGHLVYDRPSLREIRRRAQEDLATFWPEHKRLRNPQEYPVDLSRELWELKQHMIRDVRSQVGLF